MVAFSIFVLICAGLVLGVRLGTGSLEWAFRLLGEYSSGPQPYPARRTSKLG